MNKKHYDEKSVISHIMRNGIMVDFETKTIKVDPTSGKCGIHTWGKIDFLVHHCDYHVNCESFEEIKTTKLLERQEYLKAKKEAKAAAKLAKLEKQENKLIKSNIAKIERKMFNIIKKVKQ